MTKDLRHHQLTSGTGTCLEQIRPGRIDATCEGKQNPRHGGPWE